MVGLPSGLVSLACPPIVAAATAAVVVALALAALDVAVALAVAVAVAVAVATRPNGEKRSEKWRPITKPLARVTQISQ